MTNSKIGDLRVGAFTDWPKTPLKLTENAPGIAVDTSKKIANEIDTNAKKKDLAYRRNYPRYVR